MRADFKEHKRNALKKKTQIRTETDLEGYFYNDFHLILCIH